MEPLAGLGYRRGLDGIRALAILLVLGFHSGLLGGGFLGVDLFFVLSGFLITGLLVEEWNGRGQISLAGFYVRRMRRLFPALVLTIVGVGLLYLTVPGVDHGIGYWPTVASVAAYSSNWLAAFGGHHTWSSLGLLGHTWSLAIEEQFYLVWPLVLVVLLRRRWRSGAIILVLLAGVVASEALRWIVWMNTYSLEAYVRTDTHADGLLLGCALVLLLRHPRTGPLRGLLSADATLAGAAAVIGIAAVRLHLDETPTYKAGFLAIALAGTVLIAHVVLRPDAPATRLLALAPLVWIGARSYALYLFHVPVFMVLGPARTGLGTYSGLPLRWGVTFLCAALSYRYVECRFLSRRQYPRASEDQLPGSGGVLAPGPVA